VTDIYWPAPDDKEAACVGWLTEYTFSRTIIYGVALFISGLNGVLRIFLREASKHEKSHTVTKQLTSASTKMWVVMYINSGLVLLLINAKIEKWKIPDGMPVFDGKYPDFTAEWYATIGTTIAMSCLFTSVSPWANFLFACERCCKRCSDR